MIYLICVTGIFKKLQVLSKKKGCEQINDLCHSISNHLYWAAATSDGDGDLVEEKWLSILNHVCDVHEGHGDRFQACEHPPLAERSWITKGKICSDTVSLLIGLFHCDNNNKKELNHICKCFELFSN